MLESLFKDKATTLKSTNILLLKLNNTTAKLNAKVIVGTRLADNTYLIPKLGMELDFVNIKIDGSTYKLALIYDKSDALNILVFSELHTSLFTGTNESRLDLYKSVVAESLKMCIYKTTYIYNQSNSRELGEEINHLVKLYERYNH